MTNKESFEKWFENTVLNDNIHDVAEWAWSAAIAYMQEVDASSTGVATRQPLKRLSDEVVESIAEKGENWNGWNFDSVKFANAIMDEMERINK